VLIHAASKHRPYHFGPFPLEALARDPAIAAREAARPRIASPPVQLPVGPLGSVLRHYREILARLAADEPASQHAPLPDDLARRAASPFSDASHASVAWLSQFAARVRSPRFL
jgi:hypothetical protein